MREFKNKPAFGYVYYRCWVSGSDIKDSVCFTDTDYYKSSYSNLINIHRHYSNIEYKAHIARLNKEDIEGAQLDQTVWSSLLILVISVFVLFSVRLLFKKRSILW